MAFSRLVRRFVTGIFSKIAELTCVTQ